MQIPDALRVGVTVLRPALKYFAIEPKHDSSREFGILLEDARAMDRPLAKPTKPVLRLVPTPPEPAPAVAPPQPASPRPKSALGQLLSAYADAIDRDIKLVLEL